MIRNNNRKSTRGRKTQRVMEVTGTRKGLKTIITGRDKDGKLKKKVKIVDKPIKKESNVVIKHLSQ